MARLLRPGLVEVSGRVQVFIASSLDGFIAGPNDELDWLEGHGEVQDTFTPFFAGIGAMLMGRRTFDVVRGFDVEWPYGETPVLVATTRSFESPMPTVSSATGTIAEVVSQAQAVAGGRNLWIDGGQLIRSALDAGLVDDLIVTVIPVILGAGKPLFAGTGSRKSLELVTHRSLGGGLVELSYQLDS